LTSESSSDDDADSEDFRQIFDHINKGVMRRELLAGKRITVSVQDSEKAEEHGSVSWARDGEWIYTTKKERILDKGAGSPEHARHLRGKRRARRRRAAESDGESTDSTKSDSDAGGKRSHKLSITCVSLTLSFTQIIFTGEKLPAQSPKIWRWLLSDILIQLVRGSGLSHDLRPHCVCLLGCLGTLSITTTKKFP
jgi:hypothetical protein